MLFLLLLIIMSYIILKPYLIALVSAFILAYLVRPIYSRLEGKIGKNMAALISILVILALIIVPTWFVVNVLVKQTAGYFGQGVFDGLLEKVLSFSLLEEFVRVSDFSESARTIASKIIASFVLSVPTFLISIIVALIGVYYLLIDWG